MRTVRVHGREVAGRLTVVVGVLALAAGGVWTVSEVARPRSAPVTTEIPALEVLAAPVEPGTAVPVNITVGGAGGPGADTPRTGQDALTTWATKAAPVVGVPVRALRAYGHAELAMRSASPKCRLSWATLAGIGRIESNHGQYGGAVLGADGRPSKPIIGVPLDGSPGVRAIGDTDRGRFDGDSTHDRAVGPMQFIPSTWARYNSDGDGDGVGDPQQIDDAALAAARYLCVGQRDMASAQGWWAGIMSYNNSVEYAQKVFGLADTYAKGAQSVKVSG
ncbi:lytic murein transglycosylase [Amycolatopsis suaedae]|uniref:lytic murein transglycosylase n=1 Tax=Amycolatopsis suaedae TaxID=2510978 RepID=UPI003B83165D